MATLKYKNPETGAWEYIGFPKSDGMEMELLWQNASPSSSFSNQSVTIANLSEYDAYIVGARSTNAYDTIIWTPLLFRKGNEALYTMYYNTILRDICITFGDNKIAFSGSQAHVCVPVYVYGVKGVSL